MSLICLPAGDTFVPVKIEENDLYGGILNFLKVIRPNWISNNITFKTFTDGITNKLVACQLDSTLNDENEIILVRIYGNKTDLLIDRNAEIRNIKTLNVLGLAPKVYGIFENGLAYQYYPGVTLNIDTVLDVKIWPLVAQHMAKMHKVKLGDDIKQDAVVWDKIEQFLSLLPVPFTDVNKQNRFASSFGSITRLRIEFERLKSHLNKTESPIVFAHNDLLLGNVIYNQREGTIAFIDFEYAAYNYQAFDIANHFNEFVGLSIDDIDYKRYPNKEFQTSWIKVYLTEYWDGVTPNESDIEKLYTEVQQHALASHFLWGVWSLVQFELSDIDFDFGRYAEIRLNRYYELKDDIFKELI
ncbi:ethanolamine kinase [Galleria mellonella]|uniref:ethanolamine kinase n=1 Tax=Galleria mellonella TaxID=7137 RepID=A0A6J1X9L5_GALME|nr:ethanolamine kinase [Galleria mellonella]